MQLPPELGFIEAFYIDPAQRYREANWLLSDFDAHEWKYSFAFTKPKTINWHLELEDGSLLTAHKNSELLLGLKYFLSSSTRSFSGSDDQTNTLTAQAKLFSLTASIIDHLIINASHYKLAKYGLPGLTGNDLKCLLDRFSSTTESSEALYDWSNRVTEYCLNTLRNTDPNDIANLIKDFPAISCITPEQADNNTLGIPIELIPKVRASLFLNGSYRHDRKLGYIAHSSKISKAIFRNTLRGHGRKPRTIEILSFIDTPPSSFRELPHVKVTTGEGLDLQTGTFNNFRLAIYNLGTLHELSLPAPAVNDLMQIMEFQYSPSKSGRYRSLPSEMVFDSFKDAVELHLKHGKHIIDGFCRLALHSKVAGINITSFTNKQFMNIVGKDLVEMGIRQLGLSCKSTGTTTSNGPRKAEKAEYFNALRSNAGLIELLIVYLGGVQLVVGALMARRSGELIDLHAGSCLDTTEQWLIFSNRKSTRGLYGLRALEARPIEFIAVQMIKLIIRMQKILKRVGYIKDLTNLFSAPALNGAKGLTLLAPDLYNRHLDLFCDYIQTGTNKEGERYYIRQHQLRRFFAMLFFHSSNFGGLETLQWMLGHTDLRHVWHYITETLDGSALRGAKAQFIAESLHRGYAESYKNLASLLKSRYGTDDFALVETQELEDHISDLINQGEVEIEPEFFEDENGQHLRVVVKVKEIA